MSYWVHVPTDGRPWYDVRPRAIRTFEPPLPRVVPGKGYPRFMVEFDDFTFEFASLDELDRCIATLEQKNLPHTERETTARGRGPGGHWLNKLPGRVKSWHYRSRAVKYLHEARKTFAREANTRS